MYHSQAFTVDREDGRRGMRAIIIVAALGLVVSACGGETSETTTTTTTTTTSSTPVPIAYERPMRVTPSGPMDPFRGPLLIKPDESMCPTMYGGQDLASLPLDDPGWIQHRACLTLEADGAFSIADTSCVSRPEVLVRSDPGDGAETRVDLTIGGADVSVWVLTFRDLSAAQQYVANNAGAVLNTVYLPTQIYQYGPHSDPVQQSASFAVNDTAAPPGTPVIAIYDLFRGLSVSFGDGADAEAYFGPFNGHGEFVRSIVDTHLGKADLRLLEPASGKSDRVFFDELSLAVALTNADLSGAAGILNLSLGTGCGIAEDSLVKSALASLPENVLVVAAAGAHGVNPPTEQPWFPASLCRTGDEPECEYIVSVGAGEEANGQWGKAAWSNEAYLYAPGSMVLGHHPFTGSVTESGWNGDVPVPSSNYTDNAVKWSGTSFATPYVTAFIACRGDDPRQAWGEVKTDIEPGHTLSADTPDGCP
jgi:hypothetical protein